MSALRAVQLQLEVQRNARWCKPYAILMLCYGYECMGSISVPYGQPLVCLLVLWYDGACVRVVRMRYG